MPQSLERTTDQILELLTGIGTAGGAQSLEATMEAIRDALRGIGVGGGSPGEASSIHTVDVELNDAQIKALPVTGLDVIEGAAGEFPLILQAVLSSHIVVPYTINAHYLVLSPEFGNQSGGVEQADTSSALCEDLLTADAVVLMKPLLNTWVDLGLWLGSPLNLFLINELDTQPLAGGDPANTLTVNITYLAAHA